MAEPGNGIKKITENTFVPVSLLIILLGVAAWVGSIKTDVATSATLLDRERIAREELQRVLQTIDERLARIEGQLSDKGGHP